MIAVGIREYPRERVERLSGPRVGPLRLAGPQTAVCIRAQRADQDRLKRMPRFPPFLVSEDEGHDAFGFESVGNLEELIERLRRREVVGRKAPLAVPHDVRPMDVYGHGPVMPLISQQG